MIEGCTHIFFGLHGTLVESAQLQACIKRNCVRILNQRYGPADWAEAERRLMQDWDSYYADLDLDGEYGIDHLWEGLYRTTRARFRMAGRPELRALSRELPVLAARFSTPMPGGWAW